jgi:hypothetical protein
MADVTPLFRFVQLEFTHVIGPPAGRYVVAPDLIDDVPESPPRMTRADAATGVTLGFGVADVLVISVHGASAARIGLRRRARLAEAGATPADVPLLLATFVRGTAPMSDEREAQLWLEQTANSDAARNAWVEHAFDVINRAIRGYRAGARDPYVTEVTPRDPRRLRLGYGTTEQVGAGTWNVAAELPPPLAPRSDRIDRLRPSEVVGDVLAGRGVVLESEELLVRALLDLDFGRTRAAAHQVWAALQLLVGEIVLTGRLADVLQAHSAALADVVAAAVERPLEADELVELDEAIDAAERALDHWRFAPAALSA